MNRGEHPQVFRSRNLDIACSRRRNGPGRLKPIYPDNALWLVASEMNQPNPAETSPLADFGRDDTARLVSELQKSMQRLWLIRSLNLTRSRCPGEAGVAPSSHGLIVVYQMVAGGFGGGGSLLRTSLRPKSLFNREETGNFFEFEAVPRKLPAISVQWCNFSVVFPKWKSREIFAAIRGFFFAFRRSIPDIWRILCSPWQGGPDRGCF